MKALILEDDACSALALCSLLEQAGVQSFSVADTGAAMEEVRRAAPDLLFADINVLGAGSSLDVARELRSIRPDAKLFFVSGYPKEEVEEQVATLQPCFVHSKPVNFETLLEEIEPGAGSSVSSSGPAAVSSMR